MRTLITSICLLTLPLCAQDMPTPGPEHKKLAAMAGTWDAALEMMGPTGPQKSTGVSERRVSSGGFSLIDDFKADMGGMEFVGHGVLCYDPAKKKYVQAWTDSFTPMLMTMEGTYDKDGKVLTMTGMGPSHDGKLVQMRFVSTLQDANTEIFEMFGPGEDGKETRMLKITYTRRQAKPGAAK